MNSSASTASTWRAQYRQKSSGRWLTYSERDSSSSAWDELLTATSIPVGADLRVIECPKLIVGEKK
jgi:hypothetical protein